MPPSKKRICFFSSDPLESIRINFTPGFKNASSLILCFKILKLKSIFEKVLFDGRNVTVLPVRKF